MTSETPLCWKCAEMGMPQYDAQRLGLCPAHLQERVRELMAQAGNPPVEIIPWRTA